MNWIPYSKQRPTNEDANSDGDVLFRFKSGNEATMYYGPFTWNEEWESCFSEVHWLRIPDHPNAKSREEREKEEFEEWFRTVGPHWDADPEFKTIAFASWKAARKS